jgi:hypothetical protein
VYSRNKFDWDFSRTSPLFRLRLSVALRSYDFNLAVSSPGIFDKPKEMDSENENICILITFGLVYFIIYRVLVFRICLKVHYIFLPWPCHHLDPDCHFVLLGILFFKLTCDLFSVYTVLSIFLCAYLNSTKSTVFLLFSLTVLPAVMI